MSCVFDTFFARLSPEQKERVGSPANLPRFFADNNARVGSVSCNGEVLSRQRQDENFLHVEEHRNHRVGDGYFTAYADPYFFLAAHVFRVHITLNFNGTTATFCSVEAPPGTPTWVVNAVGGHMS